MQANGIINPPENISWKKDVERAYLWVWVQTVVVSLCHGVINCTDMFSICVGCFIGIGNSQVITHNGPSIYLHLMILLTSPHSFHSLGPAEVVIPPNWLRILPGLVSPQWHSFLDVETVTITRDLARIHKGCIGPCVTMCYAALHGS